MIDFCVKSILSLDHSNPVQRIKNGIRNIVMKFFL